MADDRILRNALKKLSSDASQDNFSPSEQAALREKGMSWTRTGAPNKRALAKVQAESTAQAKATPRTSSTATPAAESTPKTPGAKGRTEGRARTEAAIAAGDKDAIAARNANAKAEALRKARTPEQQKVAEAGRPGGESVASRRRKAQAAAAEKRAGQQASTAQQLSLQINDDSAASPGVQKMEAEFEKNRNASAARGDAMAAEASPRNRAINSRNAPVESQVGLPRVNRADVAPQLPEGNPSSWLKPAVRDNLTPAQALAKQEGELGATTRRLIRGPAEANLPLTTAEKYRSPAMLAGDVDPARATLNKMIMGDTLRVGENGGMTYNPPPVQSDVTLGPARSLTPRGTALELAGQRGLEPLSGAGTTGAAPGSRPIALGPIDATPIGEPYASPTRWPTAQLAGRGLGLPPASVPETLAAQPLPGSRGVPTPTGPTATLGTGSTPGFIGAGEGGILSKLRGVNDFAGMAGYKAGAAAAAEGGAKGLGKIVGGLKASPTVMGLGIPIAGGLLAAPAGTLAQRVAGGDETTHDESGIGSSDVGQFVEGAVRYGSMAAPIGMALPVATPLVVGAAAIAGGLWEAFSKGDEGADPAEVFTDVQKTMAQANLPWDDQDQAAANAQYQLLIQSGKTPEAAKSTIITSIQQSIQQQQQQEDFDRRQMNYNRDSTELMLALQGQQLAAQSLSNEQFTGHINRARDLTEQAIGTEGLSPADASYARMMTAQNGQSLAGIQNAYMQQATIRPQIEQWQQAINARQAYDSQLQSQLLARQIGNVFPEDATTTANTLATLQTPAA